MSKTTYLMSPWRIETTLGRLFEQTAAAQKRSKTSCLEEAVAEWLMNRGVEVPDTAGLITRPRAVEGVDREAKRREREEKARLAAEKEAAAALEMREAHERHLAAWNAREAAKQTREGEI